MAHRECRESNTRRHRAARTNGRLVSVIVSAHTILMPAVDSGTSMSLSDEDEEAGQTRVSGL